MGNANGFILHLSDERMGIFNDRLDEDRFAEAVKSFAHSRSLPLICFIIDTNNIITHIARGQRGMRAGTDQSRLNLSDITALTTKLSTVQVIEGVPKRNTKPVKNRFENGGLLTPRAFVEVVDLIARLAPETKSTLDRFSKSTQKRLSKLSPKTLEGLAYQKQSVTTALHLAGMDRSGLSEWTLETESAPKSFLEGLPQVRLREDVMINQDMKDVPGYTYLKDVTIPSGAVFEDGGNRLTVVLANRLPLEEQTGCDLIYYNETFKAFIMVQYKAMESDDTEGAIFRFPEQQLTKEIASMDTFMAELNNIKPSRAVNDFRLNSNPFFLKFCPRIQFNPDTTSLTTGMYIPLSYWKRLAVDNSLKGPKGGRRLAYSNVGRYFDNTSFASMVKGAWVGTTISQSQVLEKWIRKVIFSGRSLVFAVKTEKLDSEHG